MVSIDGLDVLVYEVPTDGPEQDGTLTWDSTTLVVVEPRAGGVTGFGYGYADAAAGDLIRRKLAPLVVGLDAMDTGAAFAAMQRAVRNLGRPGIAMAAISAIDTALWDLKAKLLGVPLAALLGRVRHSIPAYGSGGFTNLDHDSFAEQIHGFVRLGCKAVKIKVGADRQADPDRVAHARSVVGPDIELMVDANGALTVPHALALANEIADQGVVWFEEPVSSDDLHGLARLCREGPAGMDIAAGEYGDGPVYFRRMLDAHAVDVLQPDATRCGGVTGFMAAAALADAHGMPISAHTAPTLHAHLCCAAVRARHVEYFHDHARIEGLLFEGALTPRDGDLIPDPDRPGLGVAFRFADADRYLVTGR